MAITLLPYLSFSNNAKEAMEFYQSIFGGKLDMQTFKAFNASQDPSEDDKIMHASLEGDNGITFMAADTPNSMPYEEARSFSMSLSGDDHDTLSKFFEQLSHGGVITMPLDKAPWGDTFGMVRDKFGVTWMVNITNKD